MYADILKQIVNNYERYKNIAVNLEKVDYKCQFYDWSDWYTVSVELMVTIYEFPENYVRNNFDKAYVRMVLDDKGFESRGQDYWNIPKEKRLDYLIDKKILMNESDYYNYHRTLRMKPYTDWNLKDKIDYYAKGIYLDRYKFNLMIPYLTGAENIDICGVPALSHTFISIKDSSIMRVDCGIWD